MLFKDLDQYKYLFLDSIQNNIGTYWFGKTVEARLSIIENHNEWKEVKFSIDRYDILDSYDTNQRDEIILCLCSIFTNIVSSLIPYYGFGATEVAGVVESPGDLVVEEDHLGDVNYFSNEAAKQLDLQKFKQTFKIEHLGNVGVLLIIRKGLMGLG